MSKQKINEELTWMEIFTGMLIVPFIGMGMVMALVGMMDSAHDGGCKVNNLARLHPGYIIGCELVKKREW